MRNLPPNFIVWLLPILIWEGIWKGIGLWRSARNNNVGWFVAMFVFNTVGILPIIYIFGFDKSRKKD